MANKSGQITDFHGFQRPSPLVYIDLQFSNNTGPFACCELVFGMPNFVRAGGNFHHHKAVIPLTVVEKGEVKGEKTGCHPHPCGG
jgi:hypothetical protein